VLFRKSNKTKPAKEKKEPASGKKKSAKGQASATSLSSPLGIAAAKSGPVAKSYRKPEADFYTVMLVVALLAIIVGVVFLCLEMNNNKWDIKGMASLMNASLTYPFSQFC
jgi:hypothetical protein